jgi:hypothetical protein
MILQTLLFNTATRSAKLYEGVAEQSEILYLFDNVPTVKIEDGYYQVLQLDNTSTEEKRVPVARFPISNTNMLIKK